jgi:glycerol uptake facilitator-like aquaporin
MRVSIYKKYKKNSILHFFRALHYILTQIMYYNYFAEFLGTTFFVYVVLATGNPLAIGAAFALAMLLTAKFSGGHINPAVSIVMASLGKLP